MTVVASADTSLYQKFLPADTAVQFLGPAGQPVASSARYARPEAQRLLTMYRNMVLGRRFDEQAVALTKQGRLAVYPSSRGQEACQIAAAMCLHAQDWLFPTYRDSMALTARGIDPVEVLGMLAGDWHCCFDAERHHTAPQCTPLATQLLHAAGLAHALTRKTTSAAVLALCGDGATSEGDFHEALNFAAVFRAPVIFLVQNNGFAISVPLARQSVAPSLAHKGIGYGIGSEQVDGNDPVAMLAVLDAARDYVLEGNGPVIVEAHTYRISGHTNADDPRRYRSEEEVTEWTARDPIRRLETFLRAQGLVDDAYAAALTAEAEGLATTIRDGMNRARPTEIDDLFRYVYAEPTTQLREQQTQARLEFTAELEEDDK
ncbi:pyruvate dehydrogenase (acetyl-transferring) E1 component subunit alpha [Mycobacterium malmoense]|uniref:thiamine pyrophosphate-dependent enzyme n=1 Tax=Mycobacterium malmoense TaxID=1780 RepID=UPI00080BB0D6|nr:thiamine pyrophosphate-dependent enzyme [Mycobacterium malmoense]OCB28932.1 pyruvate dehydrogenase (acetyl-transferring) E1 component subunit alpha [Mycobacterium malmoense]OCB34420.1 pyruvate dehydrogenase (acetyl-transferring) E1 component subunit alpha [Mycobacterium malmoense]